MPNGRPGDHPYRDIVTYDADLYTARIREIVLEVDEYGNRGAKKRAESLLWGTSQSPAGEEWEQLERDLEALSDELQRASEYLSESPLEACLEDEEIVYDEDLRALVRETYEELQMEVDNTDRAERVFSALLWEAGWQPTALDDVRATLDEFRARHWIWER